MSFLEFLKQKEADLIKALDEKTWLENKVYFVSEIVVFVKEYESFKPVAEEITLTNTERMYDYEFSLHRNWREDEGDNSHDSGSIKHFQ